MDEFANRQVLETLNSISTLDSENPEVAKDSHKGFRSSRARVISQLPSLMSNPNEMRKAREKMKGKSLKEIKQDMKLEHKLEGHLSLTTSRAVRITTSRRIKEISIPSNQKGLAIGTIASLFGTESDNVLELDVSSHWNNGFEITMYYPERKGANKLLKEFGVTTASEAIFISTDPDFNLSVFMTKK